MSSRPLSCCVDKSTPTLVQVGSGPTIGSRRYQPQASRLDADAFSAGEELLAAAVKKNPLKIDKANATGATCNAGALTHADPSTHDHEVAIDPSGSPQMQRWLSEDDNAIREARRCNKMVWSKLTETDEVAADIQAIIKAVQEADKKVDYPTRK